MNGKPNIVLMQAYTFSKNYDKYLNYMIRKEAIKGKEYLDQDSKKELNRINLELEKSGYFIKVSDKSKNSDPELIKEKTFFNNTKDDYGKYINYMIRVSALAKKKALTKDEKDEKERLEKATNKWELQNQAIKKGDLNTADTPIIGWYSSEKRELRLGEAEHARQMLQEGKNNGSVLWEPVVSFDNDFLVRQGILNRDTDELHDEIIKDASYNMMEVAIKDEKLNQPFWTAAIHRNTDNIHIHFALVEKKNSREIIEYKGEQQPKAKFKLKTIYNMKSAFSNTIIDVSKTQDRITKDRNLIRQKVVDNVKESMRKDDELQKDLNELVKSLPKDRSQWQYGKLEKSNPKLTEKLDKITDKLLQDDPNYKEWSKRVLDLDELYKEQYGKSKKKNYAISQFADIKKRSGNRLLTELKGMDARLRYAKKGIKSSGKDISSDNFIQNWLKYLEKENAPKIAKRNRHSQIRSRDLRTSIAQKRQKQFQDQLDRKKLKKFTRPLLNKRTVSSLKMAVQKEFENGFTTFDKVKAMNEFNRWNNVEQE